MRSGFLKSLKMIMVLLCVGLLSILTFSCDGGGGDDGADNTPQTYTASGTYTYDSDTGVLAFTITNSNFAGCGPDVGDDTEHVDSISETTMYWPENNMLWERDSGTAGDITGTWDSVDEDGNAYEINIDPDGTMVVIGEIVDCGDNDGSGGGSGGGGGGSSSTTISGESGSQVSVVGSWNGVCDSDEDDGTSDRQMLTIVGSSFTANVSMWFESTTCSGTADVLQIISGSLTLGDELTVTLNSANVTATELDIVINASQATVFDPGVRADLNTDQECGFNDWAVGVPKNLMGTSCMSETNQKDVIYIDDTTDPDVWYFGEEEGPFDTNGYPVVLDLESEAERM